MNKFQTAVSCRDILLSWDTYAAVASFLLLKWLLPPTLAVDLLQGILEFAVTVNSILFSILFAAFAIVISIPSKEFIKFFDDEGDFRMLIGMYGWTLGALFLSLMLGVIILLVIVLLPNTTVFTSLVSHLGTTVACFTATFIYSLVSALARSTDSIKMIHGYLVFINKQP